MLPNRITLGLPPKEKLFVMLVGVLGVPAGKAYQIAISDKASMPSATATASKLLRENRIQESLRILWRRHEQGELDFNERVLDF